MKLWNLSDAMRYVRERQTGARQNHYDLSLSGGLLSVAFSNNNIDIVATPVEDHKLTMDNYLDFINWLNANNFLRVEQSGYNGLMRRHTFHDERGRQVDYYVVAPI